MNNRFVGAGRRLVLSVLVALVALMISLPQNASATDATTVDLSRYVRVGRYNLPEPTRTTPPDGISLLAQEASSVTYDWDTDTLFVVGDGGTSVVQVSKTGALIDSMTLAAGSSPQGTTFYDTEGITYVGSGKFVMTEERDRQLVLFTYVAGTTLTRAAAQTVKLGTTIGNIGLEGVTYDPSSSATCNSTSIGFIVVKEKDPRSIFQTCVDFAAGTATNGSPTTVESTDLFDPALINVIDFSDVFALSNLPALSGGPQYQQLLIISQESGQVVQVDRSGNVLHTMTLVADPGDTISIPDMTNEGVTIDRNGILYIADEDGGGDINHPQLWVYAPSMAVNMAPTAITLTGPVTSIPENTSTGGALKLADILVTDDGLGDNNLSVSGSDAGSFQIIGTALFLKAGTLLNAATKPSYSINVDVDDPTVGGSPDASAAYTLTITAAVSGGAINLAITEAAPWSSGNSNAALAADWFEVTNFGTGTVSLVGWTMDDNSNSFGVSVPLHGVANIAPGESVIFIETADLSDSTLATKAAAFINLWFGGVAPAGLQIGSYSGSGVGLSTGGDAVNLFDNGGTLHASISFPAVAAGPPFYTFDNTAGLNNTPISNLSSVGLYGAHFATNDANEIGSPGTIGSGAAPIVNITATDASASETGPDPGSFRITRSGSVVSSLTVNYTIAAGAGQATSGDYTPTLTGSAMIAAGNSFVDLTITPVDDALVEGAETLTLTLSDTGSYDVGSSPSATVTIADNDAVIDLPPTAVVLSNTVPTLSEATSTASAVRVADISIVDDGLGVNTLSLSGADAASFQITGASLFLKAGTALNHVTKPSYSVTVNVDDPTVGGNPDAFANFTLTIASAVAPGTIVISEVAPWSSSNSPLAADWFEVTNTGRTPADITGWKMDDNSHAIGSAVVLNGVTSIAPGEAVIFIETADLPTTAAAFRSLWFGSHPPAGLQIGSYSGSGVGLSSSGDEVNLFDSTGNLVTGVGFGAAPASAPFATFDNHSGAGGTTIPLPTFSTLSAPGVNRAFAAANDLNEIGSPGIGNVGRLIISEVAPWGSSTSSYAADWFEVTNVGSASVDMTGWQMDDNSNGTAKVSLLGVAGVSPGHSAVFIETTGSTPATVVPAFEAAWFGSSIPGGFTIGTYGGSGVGLSGTADAVNVFDAAGNRMTGVSFGASTSNFSFDNTAALGSPVLPLLTISTLSVAGINGAFLAADGAETGSPGLALLADFADAIAPTASPAASPAANGAGWNDSDVTVDWNWSDNPGGSGIDNANCTASTLSSGEGTLLLSATCKDLRGNTGNASFTVKVDETDPTVTASATKADSTPYAFGTWSNQNVTVHFMCSDAGSGIASCAPDVTISAEGGTTASGSGTDNAGRSGNSGPLSVEIDKTPPIISFSGNAGSYTVDDIVSITCNASDALSGLASSTCPGVSEPAYALSLGHHSLHASAVDQAGNASSLSANFTVSVTLESLAKLTGQFVRNDRIARALEEELSDARHGKEKELDEYIDEVREQSGKALTSGQAAILVDLTKDLEPKDTRFEHEEHGKGGDHDDDRDDHDGRHDDKHEHEDEHEGKR